MVASFRLANVYTETESQKKNDKPMNRPISMSSLAWYNKTTTVSGQNPPGRNSPEQNPPGQNLGFCPGRFCPRPNYNIVGPKQETSDVQPGIGPISEVPNGKITRCTVYWLC